MIRYEIFSTAAASETGLRDNPELMDLADTLAVKDIEARFIKQVVREEEQINVANKKTAKGITVKERAVKTLQPQTSLKGCLNWMRVVTARFDRGLHLHLEKVRGTNGTALILSQIFARGQQAFVSGMDNGNYERMVAQPDITLKKIPPEIAKSPEIKNDYRQRGARATSFYAVLGDMAELTFLPKDFLDRVKEILPKRDPNRLRDFSEAEIVNVGLIADLLDRYKSLLANITMLVQSGEHGTDLAAFFNMLTQGIDFAELKKALIPFTIESKRARIDNKRVLINELRIYLSRSDPGQLDDFRAKLTPIVIKARLAQDTALYRKVVPLKLADAEETDTLAAARQLYKALFDKLENFDPSRVDPAAAVPADLKQLTFEMLVGLTYLGEFTAHYRPNYLPKKAALARELIGRFAFKEFNPATLQTLNPKLPARGVAQNLTKKVPLTMGELLTTAKKLNRTLFPLVPLAATLAKSIGEKTKGRQEEDSVAAKKAFMEGAYPLLRNSDFLLGKAGQISTMHGAAASAGVKLGLTFLTPEQAAKKKAVGQKFQQTKEFNSDGFISLMNSEEKRFLPLRAGLDADSQCYRYLYGEHVAGIVRQFISRKINYLQLTHGVRLFEVMYQHVVWDHQLEMSRYQLGMILFRQKIFEPVRLKEFGFNAGAMDNGHERDNPWLHTKDENNKEESSKYPYVAGRVEKEYQAAGQAFNGLMKKMSEMAKSNGDTESNSLSAIITRNYKNGLLDPYDPAFRKAVAESDAASALWHEVQQITINNLEELVPEDLEGEALEFTLPGAMAFLTLLKDSHTFKIEEKEFLFRIKGGRDMKASDLGARSQLMAKGISKVLNGGSGSPNVRLIKSALELIQAYCKSWSQFRRVSEVVLTDQILQETIHRAILPSPPDPAILRKLPPQSLMCLGMSSSDQAKFNRVNTRPDLKGTFATLSQLANSLSDFQRLRQEMDEIRAVVNDVVQIIEGFNVSVFEAPYILRYAENLRELDVALSVQPENMDVEDLEHLQKCAMGIESMRREFFAKEADFAPKDRWLNRVTIRLRQVRPATDLGFVQQLYGKGVKLPDTAEEENEAATQIQGQKADQHQTFTERAQSVIQYRRHLLTKSVFVLSPGPKQRDLTISVIDQLARLKGLFTPILADISNCEVFLDDLRTRLPPHRLFNLNDLG